MAQINWSFTPKTKLIFNHFFFFTCSNSLILSKKRCRSTYMCLFLHQWSTKQWVQKIYTAARKSRYDLKKTVQNFSWGQNFIEFSDLELSLSRIRPENLRAVFFNRTQTVWVTKTSYKQYFETVLNRTTYQ